MFAAIIGAVIGLKTGGAFGMLFGGMLGYYISNLIFEANPLSAKDQRSQVQQEYFNALFICIGKIAKADGVVTRDEIDRCEYIIRRMNLSPQQRQKAIELFNLGKQPNVDLGEPLGKLSAASRGAYTIKQMFMEMLLEVAVSRNQIHSAEWQVMLQICQHLRFSKHIFMTLARMRGFDPNNQQRSGGDQRQRQQSWSRAPSQTNPYQVLGVNSSDSKTVIRRAYKKLMSTHHPDKLVAKGVPPEMMDMAKEKTQEIQKAWEEIKRQRGF